MPAPAPAPAPTPETTPTSVKGKVDMTFYGFVQLYGIYDSTQGLNEQAQNTAIARPGTYAGNHGQFTMSARHSRFGFKLGYPVSDDIKASGNFEMDFLNTQPAGFTEAQFFQNPMMRYRHVYLKLETPWLDVYAGQYWSLFGWQSMFQPNTLEIQGTPAQVYSRIPQLRLAKTIKSEAVNIDVGIAAERAPQRASATPDGVAGIKASFNKLKGWHTKGAADSGLDSAAIGVSVIGRRFAVDQFSAAPSGQVVKYGYGLSIDGMVPIVPATKESHANALTLTGSFVTGAGISDQYNGLGFGVSQPGLPNPMMLTPAPAYTPNIDNALTMYWLNASTGSYELHPVQLTSYMVGLQYYAPPAGKMWVAANYAHLSSGNAHLFGTPSKIWDSVDYVDGCVFGDLTSAVRIAAEFSWINQTYVAPDANGKTDAPNYRAMGSLLLLF